MRLNFIYIALLHTTQLIQSDLQHEQRGKLNKIKTDEKEKTVKKKQKIQVKVQHSDDKTKT